MSDSLEGEFTGGDVLNDDMGYCNQGVAQGVFRYWFRSDGKRIIRCLVWTEKYRLILKR